MKTFGYGLLAIVCCFVLGCSQSLQVKLNVKEGASNNNTTPIFVVFAKDKDLPIELGNKDEFLQKYEKAEFSQESTKIIKTPLTRREFLENVQFFNAEDFVVVKCIVPSETSTYEFLLELVESYSKIRLYLPTEYPEDISQFSFITVSCDKARTFVEKKE